MVTGGEKTASARVATARVGPTRLEEPVQVGEPGRVEEPGRVDGVVRRSCRLLVGLLLGSLTAVLEVVFLLAAGVALLPVAVWPRPRLRVLDRIESGSRRLADLERARLAAYLGADSASPRGDRRALTYIAVRWPVGLLGGAVLGLLCYGAVVGVAIVAGWTIGLEPDGIALTWPLALYFGIAGLVLLYLALQGLAGVAAMDRRLARRFLGPSERELLQSRISELASSRAGIVAAVDAERRRIERDLHDGVQQRLVALAMLLGRTRRSDDPNQHADLLRQAHEESQQVLRDLREVAWRVYPSALDTLGLADALAAVAERSEVPVRIGYDLPERLPSQVETVVYFVVCEAVTNAAKHGGAALVSVDLGILERPGSGGHESGHGYDAGDGGPRRSVRVRISDDGVGGADPDGGGLSGLARRVLALDGSFRLDSPAGGPTTITVELPCG
ncbi:sensor histidine kinase [Actinopolymorpha pittospori]